MSRGSRARAYGDFQTPLELARAACALLGDDGFEPAAIVEPCCGRGNFLRAACERFPHARALGFEIDADHAAAARAQLGARAEIGVADFFTTPWERVLAGLPDPLLVTGNPPWVTNAELGRLGAANLPHKHNAARARGIDALTGQSNFDISEWMLERALEWLAGRDALLAVLCKTAVARRLLATSWRGGRAFARAELFAVDTARHFSASVSAGLLVLRASAGGRRQSCALHAGLAREPRPRRFGWRGGELVADVRAWPRARRALGSAGATWRSGVKHDCAPVMELERAGALWRNGLGEEWALESDHLFPLLKCTDLARGAGTRERVLLVPQRAPGEPTDGLRERAPRTWDYLCAHAARLDARKSSIYRGRPRFALFGVGPYTFAPYKVAVSGFHLPPRFRVLGPRDGRPVLLDDTCYFLSFDDEGAAARAAALLETPAAGDFFAAFAFPDAKRPLTARLLRRLDLGALAGQA
jgi:hypothetical protein